MKHHNITFIGGGNMGKSLIKGIINAGYPTEKITVSTPFAEEVAKLKETFGINGTTSNPEAAKEADIVVMAVKPQMMQIVQMMLYIVFMIFISFNSLNTWFTIVRNFAYSDR